MVSSLTKTEMKDFLKRIDGKITLKEEADTSIGLYIDNNPMDIFVFGNVENGTEWTLQTLKMEVEVYLDRKNMGKLIISEENYENPRRKGASSRRAPNRRKAKSNEPKDRF